MQIHHREMVRSNDYIQQEKYADTLQSTIFFRLAILKMDAWFLFHILSHKSFFFSTYILWTYCISSDIHYIRKFLH